MVIYKTDTIQDIQDRFSSLYPLLRIKFYSQKHDNLQGSSKSNELKPITPISSISKFSDTKILQFDENTSVSELEAIFEYDLSLHVQVFRNSGDVWLQTMTTDKWTLKQQMDHAKVYINVE